MYDQEYDRVLRYARLVSRRSLDPFLSTILQSRSHAVLSRANSEEEKAGFGQLDDDHGVFADYLADHSDPREQLVRDHGERYRTRDSVYSQAGKKFGVGDGFKLGAYFKHGDTLPLPDGTLLGLATYHHPDLEHPVVGATWRVGEQPVRWDRTADFEALYSPEETHELLDRLDLGDHHPLLDRMVDHARKRLPAQHFPSRPE